MDKRRNRTRKNREDAGPVELHISPARIVISGDLVHAYCGEERTTIDSSTSDMKDAQLTAVVRIMSSLEESFALWRDVANRIIIDGELSENDFAAIQKVPYGGKRDRNDFEFALLQMERNH